MFRFQKRKYVIRLCSFSSFQTPADTSNIYIHQPTQLTKVANNIIEREFVATAIILIYYNGWYYFSGV